MAEWSKALAWKVSGCKKSHGFESHSLSKGRLIMSSDLLDLDNDNCYLSVSMNVHNVLFLTLYERDSDSIVTFAISPAETDKAKQIIKTLQDWLEHISA